MRKYVIVFIMLLGSAPMAAKAAPLRFDSPSRWLEIPFNTPAANASRVAFGKVDNNVSEDLVLYHADRGEVYVALSTDHGFATPKLFASGLPKFANVPFEIALTDVNGDGRDDLIIFNHGVDDVPGAATALVAFSTATSFTFIGDPVKNASWCANYQICLAGDVTGDKRGDFVAFTPNFGTTWVSPSQGGTSGPNAIWNNYFCIRGEVCALGDVDGDGRGDAILFKPNAPGVQKGNVLWARSSGTSFVDVKYGHGYFCIDNERCLVGDVNGDKRADIVLIKGWSSGATTLEVLVSISDGTKFVNAVPFQWSRPPSMNPEGKSFGTFQLADVTGDGRADLVEFGSLSVTTPGGGQRITAFAVDVLAVTDRAPVQPPTVPQQPSSTGFSAVKVYNCNPDQHRLTFWNLDSTSGTSSQTGAVDAMYSESGFCPDPNDQPQTLSLLSGHVHTIIAVDPEAIGCDGRNDPDILGCRNNSASFRGDNSGPVCNWIVSAQSPTCAISLQTRSFPLSVRSADDDRCVQGYVWREARPMDHVCVTPAVREETAHENAGAERHRSPTGGQYGRDSCLSGFVWREAFEGDVVCVPPASRSRAREDNAAALGRRAKTNP